MNRLFIAGLNLRPNDMQLFIFLILSFFIILISLSFGIWRVAFHSFEKVCEIFSEQKEFYGFWWNTPGNKRISDKDIPEFLEGNALLNFGVGSPNTPQVVPLLQRATNL